MKRQIAWALLGCCLVLVAAGCGSSKKSSSSSSGSSTSSGGDFATQAQSICTTGVQKVRATLSQVQQISSGGGTAADKRAKASALFGDFQTTLKDLHDKLTPLTPPAAQASAYKQYVDSLSTLGDQAGKLKTDLAHSDKNAYSKDNSALQAEVQTSNAAGNQVPALKTCVTGSA